MGKFCKDTLCERRNLEQTLFKLDQRKKKSRQARPGQKEQKTIRSEIVRTH